MAVVKDWFGQLVEEVSIRRPGMAVVKDWISEAARDIADETSNLDSGDVRRILLEHVPFEDGVAYMPVPRCDGCKHWSAMGIWSPRDIGVCGRLKSFNDPAQPVSLWTVSMWNDNQDTQLRTHRDFGCVAWEEK